MVRVSIASLLRIRTDNTAEGSVVLFNTGRRLDPPGGALAYFESAANFLASLGWQPERPADSIGLVDLRGLLLLARLDEFRDWLATDTDREDDGEGLRRELIEELGEIGFPHLAGLAAEINFQPVTTVVEGPYPLEGQSYYQLRHLVVQELVPDGPQSLRLREHLVALASDPTVHTVVSTGAADIAAGHIGGVRIGTHVPYLMGSSYASPHAVVD